MLVGQYTASTLHRGHFHWDINDGVVNNLSWLQQIASENNASDSIALQNCCLKSKGLQMFSYWQNSTKCDETWIVSDVKTTSCRRDNSITRVNGLSILFITMANVSSTSLNLTYSNPIKFCSIRGSTFSIPMWWLRATMKRYASSCTRSPGVWWKNRLTGLERWFDTIPNEFARIVWTPRVCSNATGVTHQITGSGRRVTA